MTQMKKIVILAALVLSMSASAFAIKPATVKVVSRNCDLVYFKVSEDMIGADIAIHDSMGHVIHTTNITDKRVIVDFYAEPSGDYKIVVKKNDHIQEISYKKFTRSHAALADHNYVVVIQM